MKTYIIAGLGNPGDRYTNTRHNLGFKTIDQIALHLGIEVTRMKWNALIGEGRLGEDKLILVKPQTFMNRSGQALAQILNFYKIPVENLLVIHDDIDIKFGTIRVRRNGAAGTHNGMKSVIKELDSKQFPRIRLSIGKRPSYMDLADFVLGNFTKEEIPIINDEIEAASQAAIDWMEKGLDYVMNEWNGWTSAALPKPTAQDIREAKKEKKRLEEQEEFKKNCDYCGK